MEIACKEEKDSLVILVDKYLKAISSVIIRFNLKKKDVENNEDFVKLFSEFNETNNKLLDSEYFRKVLGEKLTIFQVEDNRQSEDVVKIMF
jgi:hypothetical protein